MPLGKASFINQCFIKSSDTYLNFQKMIFACIASLEIKIRKELVVFIVLVFVSQSSTNPAVYDLYHFIGFLYDSHHRLRFFS